jgi:hypothetical protein
MCQGRAHFMKVASGARKAQANWHAINFMLIKLVMKLVRRGNILRNVIWTGACLGHVLNLFHFVTM